MVHDIPALSQIINEKIRQLKYSGEPKGLYEPINYVLAMAGKRLRPILCLASCNLFQEDIELAIEPALGLEVFHNFTLLHDDIMDNAPLRRNSPTVHVKWNDNSAILSGDAMSILAYRFMLSYYGPESKEMLELFTRTALEVCEGQQYDMDFEDTLQVSVADYLNMITLKTSVLIAASLQLGAIIGKATKSDQKLLYSMGKNIGLAFQLQDDLLDVYGDVAVFGKQIGGDIVANKKTFLLVNALENANTTHRSELIRIMTTKKISDAEKISAVRQIYDDLDLKKITTEAINRFFDAGIADFDQVKIDPTRKSCLMSLLQKLNVRNY